MMKTRFAWIVSMLFLSAAPASGQTAGMLSFQGLIKDDSPDGLFDGTADLQFRIYDAEAGGNIVDMDGDGVVEDVVGQDVKEVLDLSISDGIASTKFGPVSPKAFDGNPRWLEVRIDGVPLSRIEMATPPAIAEQLNRPASGTAGATTDTSSLEVVGGPPVIGSGFISSTGNTVMGSGTAFTEEIHVGDLLIFGAQEQPVVDIVSDTELKIEDEFDPPATDAFYQFQQPILRLTDSAGQTVFRVDAQGAGLGMVPVGSIIAWHKSFANTAGLPSGWLECNGQVLNDPESPYDGQALPNLNSASGYFGGRFLRGGNVSGTLQDSTTLPHQNARSQTGALYIIDSDGTGPSISYLRQFDSFIDNLPGTTDRIRTVNMSVVWIMRIK